MTDARTKLPWRRQTVTVALRHRTSDNKSIDFYASYGVKTDADGARYGETFCKAFKIGSDQQAEIHDACRLASVALQCGQSFADLAHTLEEKNAPRAGTILGTIIRQGVDLDVQIAGDAARADVLRAADIVAVGKAPIQSNAIPAGPVMGARSGATAGETVPESSPAQAVFRPRENDAAPIPGSLPIEGRAHARTDVNAARGRDGGERPAPEQNGVTVAASGDHINGREADRNDSELGNSLKVVTGGESAASTNPKEPKAPAFDPVRDIPAFLRRTPNQESTR